MLKGSQSAPPFFHVNNKTTTSGISVVFYGAERCRKVQVECGVIPCVPAQQTFFQRVSETGVRGIISSCPGFESLRR